jgi:hypothetical protein
MLNWEGFGRSGHGLILGIVPEFLGGTNKNHKNSG